MSEEVDVTRKAEYLFAGILDAWRAVESKGIHLSNEDIATLGRKIRDINAIIAVNESDSYKWTDRVEFFQNTKRDDASDSFGFAGSVEITIEDKNGNVKQRVVKKNALTQAYKLYALHESLNVLQTTKRCALRDGYNFVYKNTIPLHQLAFYCTDKESQESDVPPFVGENLIGLNDDVTFYNINNSLIESGEVIVSNDSNSYFDGDMGKCESVCEYVKTTGSGTFKSIVFGRDFSKNDARFIVAIRDPKMPSDFFSEHTHFMLEMKESETIAWRRTSDPNNQLGYSFKTKKVFRASSPTFHANILTASFRLGDESFRSLGIKVGNDMYKLLTVTSWNPITMVLVKTIDCVNSTSIVNLTLQFTKKNGFTDGNIDGSYHFPTLTYKNSTTLEVFQTVGIGIVGDRKKFNIWKAIINLTTFTAEYVDLGEFDFNINSNPTDGMNQCGELSKLGLWDESTQRYYLPSTHKFDKNNFMAKMCRSAFWAYLPSWAYITGYVLDQSLNIIENINFSIPYGQTVNQGGDYFNDTRGSQLVFCGDGNIKQCRLTEKQMPFIYSSAMSSYLNLETPITKEEDDLLRIRYIDKMD